MLKFLSVPLRNFIQNILAGEVVEVLGDGLCLWRSVAKIIGIEPGQLMAMLRISIDSMPDDTAYYPDDKDAITHRYVHVPWCVYV